VKRSGSTSENTAAFLKESEIPTLLACHLKPFKHWKTRIKACFIGFIGAFENSLGRTSQIHM
tara:strand:+ start:112 stop:297 length:186 start_codon:yes stop_codon:yes gene_type:complete